ncbi:hypothetical protein V7S79_08665 [Aquirufa sp. ROCK-SH2]
MIQIKRLYFIIPTFLFFACQSENIVETNPTNFKPSNLKISSGDYNLKIQWDSIKSTSIKSYKIYRDTLSAPTKILVENYPNCTFVDKLIIPNKKYYYRISSTNLAGIESEYSVEINGKAEESINTATPINGEIGGLNYAYWDFPKKTFTKISHEFTIHRNPTASDGSVTEDGLYYQFYQGQLNDDIGFYYGIQNLIYNPNGGTPKKGIIFSRWGTRDIQNYKLAPGGFGQSAGYEGDFIGIRLNYEWTIGNYLIELKLDSSDNIGDWYGLYLTKKSSNEKTYVGSIRFEKGIKSQGIKTGGITWTELFSKKNKLSPLPNWHISVDQVLADDTPPNSVSVDYNPNKFVGFTNIFTTNKKDIHFLMGPKVKKVNPSGRIW